MQWTPALDPKRFHLEKLLAARGVSLDWLNSGDTDPHCPANVARYSIVAASKIIPFHFRDATTDSPEILAWLQELTDQARETQAERGAPVASVNHGRSLLLLGPTGTGKTHQTYGAIRELAITGVAATWVITTAADMYAALRPRHGIDSEVEFRRYRDASVLLLDDLGAERKPTEFTEEINFRLINWRYENHKPTLITSNLLPKEISARLGDRVTSRLIEMCQRVVFKGPDRRRGEAA
ncbi:ATP-binding protein [Streptomyces europaeiscabiei]|uniref:ATP-binding protein n=2 Tax=Streptomyces europaeiscabiei TaxID=146819 RepID=UPI0029B0E536|nr:ATP-binding protein [Streptomyces europaeiscabiei]MDX2528001.1 ATP-binding protein [Streptomyces europaeiscabiei]MDX2761602.1 ATP-binding protein [Streptomyces europaeiscabiei]MDX3549560.1 ATP-binding protein [Streptomyces europaeiscabiei]